MSTLHGKHLIAGKREAGTPGKKPATNPATGEVLPPGFCEATPVEVDKACYAAEEAFAAMRQAEPERIADLLDRVGEEIMALGDALIDRCHRETALPAGRLEGERARTVGQAKMFAELVRKGDWVDARVDTAQPTRTPLPKPDIRVMLRPIGPVVVFGASNFPLAFSVAGGDTVSALAAGCPVLVKANRAHPGTSEMVGEAVTAAVRKAGLPGGSFSMLHGKGKEVGTALTRHPAVRGVGFTGSYAGGKTLFDMAARRPDPIPVFAEMGSINPVFVLPGAITRHPKKLASAYIQSVTLGVGQFCTNPGLVFGIAGPELDLFMDAVAREAETWAPETMLHAGICSTFGEGLETLDAIPGVRRLAASKKQADAERYEAPCVIYAADSETYAANSRLASEVFGPASVIIACRDMEDMMKMARELDGHLTASVHLDDEELSESRGLFEVLGTKVGRLIRNGFPTGVEVCPSMQHGGPFPATTDGRFTSVGTSAIRRWVRPVAYQNFDPDLLPAALRDDNPLGIYRLVNGKGSRESIS